MNGILTSNRFARIINLPLSFPQTELRSGGSVIITQIALARHQRLEVRSLTVLLAAILTPGAVPVFLNTAMGLCSVGVYRSTMLTSPLAYAAFIERAATANPFAQCVIETPGTYTVIASNNTSNLDLAVTATGTAKIYF